MPSKEKVIVSLNKDRYSKQEVQHLINSITHIEAHQSVLDERKPSYLKKGDVFTCKDSGGKPRPYVIIKVLQENVVAIPQSTTEDSLCLCKSKSRFLSDGWFSKQFVTVKKEVAMEKWTGIYCNEKSLRKAIKELKQYINETI